MYQLIYTPTCTVYIVVTMSHAYMYTCTCIMHYCFTIIYSKLNNVYFISMYLDATITKDIRHYLASRFTKNSVDSELQHQIRENLHTRVIPCKWCNKYK